MYETPPLNHAFNATPEQAHRSNRATLAARLIAESDLIMRTPALIILVCFPFAVNGVCLDPPGIPSSRLEDLVERSKECAVDNDCVVLGCSTAFNQTAARYALNSPGHLYTVNCARSVHDGAGNCLITAKCLNKICVLEQNDTAAPSQSEH